MFIIIITCGGNTRVSGPNLLTGRADRMNIKILMKIDFGYKCIIKKLEKHLFITLLNPTLMCSLYPLKKTNPFFL